MGFAGTVGRRDAAVELTGMYLQRVPANPVGLLRYPLDK